MINLQFVLGALSPHWLLSGVSTSLPSEQIVLGSADLPICSNTSLPVPVLDGARIISFEASHVYNGTVRKSLWGDGYETYEYHNLYFCNVSISYGHPGQNISNYVEVWLPDDWNGRFLGTGGGGFGWMGGYFEVALAPAVLKDYAAVSTNAGHDLDAPTAAWALSSPGNVNLNALDNFAAIAINDMSLLGKGVTESFYGRPPKYSYWNGCSQGGRQGLMMAQRFPDVYQGILAEGPAMNWGRWMPSLYWPHAVMNELRYFPRPCELQAITRAATKACDALDGVADGIISDPSACKFDPAILVGQSFICNDEPATITEQAATIAREAWTGPTDDYGAVIWPGLAPDAVLDWLAGTKCDNGVCLSDAFSMAEEWIRLFVLRNESFDVTTILPADMPRLIHASEQRFKSIIGTDDPDLSEFRKAGGKLLTWHGMADEIIPPQGTARYYDSVRRLDPGVDEYYRHFQAPGVGHCWGGVGPYAVDIQTDLVEWVENGRAPVVIKASTATASDGKTRSRDLCQYPSMSVYTGGDVDSADSYTCLAR